MHQGTWLQLVCMHSLRNGAGTHAVAFPERTAHISAVAGTHEWNSQTSLHNLFSLAHISVNDRVWCLLQAWPSVCGFPVRRTSGHIMNGGDPADEEEPGDQSNDEAAEGEAATHQPHIT